MNNKKDFKVIQLNGPMGIILAVTIVFAVLCSIIIMPVYGIKFLWNTFISETFEIQTIRLAQASLLWFAIIAVAYGYIRSKISFKFVNATNLPEDSLNKVDYEKFLDKIKEEQENNEKIKH